MINMMTTHIWYLGHSGFALLTGDRMLIFDYYLDKPANAERGLGAGVVTPGQLAGYDVSVFASHRHHDHFNPVILGWAGSLPRVRYILSSDIKRAKTDAELHSVKPGETLQTGEMTVKTLDSTDEGVAFLVKVNGLTIYHAGDLNWWHWEGEPERDNLAMAKKYCSQIDLLRGEKIDIAFLPTDLRQEGQYCWGFDYFMRNIGAEAVFPMHFWEDYSVFDRLKGDPATEPYRNKIRVITHRGQKFSY